VDRYALNVQWVLEPAFASDWSVIGLPVTVRSPAKTAEPVEMPFWLWARVGSRNRVLDKEGAILRAKRGDSL